MTEESKETLGTNDEFSDDVTKKNGTLGKNDNDPGDPCYSHEWSILLCCVMIMAFFFWILFIVRILQKKKLDLNGLERLFIFLGLCSIVQFGPLLSAALHAGHGVYHYSQTSCKLMFYTEYGTRHTITFLVMSAYLYGHLGLRHGFQSVDRRLQENTGWLALLLLAIECVFGMAPAVYVDVFPFKTRIPAFQCIWTLSLDLSFSQTVSMEIIERSFSPYLVPMLIVGLAEIFLSFFSASLVQLTRHVTEPGRKSLLLIILITVSTYFALNFMYSVIIVVEYSSKISETGVNNSTLCRAKWFSILVHQLWFSVAPAVYICMARLIPEDVAKVGHDVVVIIKSRLSSVAGSSSRSSSSSGSSTTHEHINRLPSC
eukprot:TRINITY_DN1867_c0_g1_i4.p1 TRINITY_DN1867_c0_g1~~TRINITY_DN1867_c0_g1_i4.p1  ORF type:complete len:372 (-),score=73.67 TRINITY_DN1867_c0_g1_i4:1133-2248(-)